MFNETRCQRMCRKSKNDSWGEAEMWKQRHWKVSECLVPKCVGCDKDTPIGPPVTFPNGTFCRFGSNHAPITHRTCTTAVQPFVCGNPRSCSCRSCSHSVHYYLVNLRNYKMAHFLTRYSSSVAICTFALVVNIVASPIGVTKFKYTWLRVFVPTLLTEVSVAVYYDKCYISPCKC